MSEGRRRRIEGSVVGRDDDIGVDFVAFIQFESADDKDSVGFPSNDDNDGTVGCLGADSDADGGMHVGGAVERHLVLRRAGRVRAGGAAVSMMTNLVGEATRWMIVWRCGDDAAADDILPRDAIQMRGRWARWDRTTATSATPSSTWSMPSVAIGSTGAKVVVRWPDRRAWTWRRWRPPWRTAASTIRTCCRPCVCNSGTR
jgi:hypothetical protein